MGTEKVEEWEEEFRPGGAGYFKRTMKTAFLTLIPEETQEEYHKFRHLGDSTLSWQLGRICMSLVIVLYVVYYSDVPANTKQFIQHCDEIALGMSSAKVKYKVKQ